MADLSTAEAAAEIGVHLGTLQRWAKTGRVKPKYRTAGAKGRGHYRWDIDDLRDQLRRLGDPPLPSPPGRKRANPAADSMRLAMRKR